MLPHDRHDALTPEQHTIAEPQSTVNDQPYPRQADIYFLIAKGLPEPVEQFYRKL